MKRHHVHRWLLESHGSQVKGRCTCGKTKVFANTFLGAIAIRFGKGKKGEQLNLIDNLAAQSRALREVVSEVEVSLGTAAEGWRKGER